MGGMDGSGTISNAALFGDGGLVPRLTRRDSTSTASPDSPGGCGWGEAEGSSPMPSIVREAHICYTGTTMKTTGIGRYGVSHSVSAREGL